MLTEELKAQLIERLKATDPHKIILFGSYAHGTSRTESDVDLLVVTDDDFLPVDFAEKNAIYLRVSNAITEIEKQIPIDLIVHTKAMHRKFIEMGGLFSKTITTAGKVLYEKTH